MRSWILGAVALTLTAGNFALAAFPKPPPEKLKGAPLVPARLPDGRPNWTGFWTEPNGLVDTYRGPSALEGAPPDTNKPFVRKDIPPMKSPYKEQYLEAVQKALDGTIFDAQAACLPPGMPAQMVAPYGMEILQTPKIIAITSEAPAVTRRIWMDIKKHPPIDELDPTYSGHSIGRWEGDTLVVDTVGLREDVPLDFSYLPHGPNTRIIERFRAVSPGVMVVDVTVEDPDVFETPWKYQNVYHHKPDYRLGEYVCLENNRRLEEEAAAKSAK